MDISASFDQTIGNLPAGFVKLEADMPACRARANLLEFESIRSAPLSDRVAARS